MQKGSLQSKHGKYYAVFYVNKKLKWVNLNIPTIRGNKRKAQQAMQQIIAEYEMCKGQDILFTEYICKWLYDVKGIVKPSTYETYTYTIERKIIPYFGNKKLKLTDLKPCHFTEYFKYLKIQGASNGGTLSEKTVKNIKGVLTAILDTAHKNKLISNNPVLDSKMPTFEDNIQNNFVVYTPEEVKKLLQTAKESESHIYLFLLIALFTGIRKGELMGLTWDNINFEDKTLTVNKSRTGGCKAVTSLVTTPKTNSSNRTIPLTDVVINELKEEQKRQQENKEFFGNGYIDNHNFIIRNKKGEPYSNLTCINRVVGRLQKKAGLPHCTIHGFRHTVANILDSNGVSIQDISILLGHEHVGTTEKIYIHRNKKAKRENVDLLDNLFKQEC